MIRHSLGTASSILRNALPLALLLSAFFSIGCAPRLTLKKRPPEQLALAPAKTGELANLSKKVASRFGSQKSAFHLLLDNEEALMWRLALIDHATTSIDIQYYLWNNDDAGRLLFMRLLDAADRGVRVRLLIDDFLLAGGERPLAAICYHPNFEIKVFNPKLFRKSTSGQLLEWGLNFDQLNRRMHNKAFIVDNRAAIMGGRNIGNPYFGLSEKYNFIDVDVLTCGRVVEDITTSFDLFWNSELALPGHLMARQVSPKDTERAIAKLRAVSAKKQELLAKTNYPLKRKNWSRRFKDVSLKWHPGTALMLYDQPITKLTKDRESFLISAPDITAQDNPTELLVVSPYLIPSEAVYKSLSRNTNKGATVRILTASLGATNQPLVHSHFCKHRKEIIARGGELYEFRHDPSPAMREFTDVHPVRSKFVSIHAKTAVGDRKNSFIGSLNLDPRSAYLNTENGLLIESPALAAELAAHLELLMATQNAWQVSASEPDGKGPLRWQSNGEVRTSQPAPHFGKRISNFFYGLLPIEEHL